MRATKTLKIISTALLFMLVIFHPLKSQVIHTSASQIFACPQDTGVVAVNVTGLMGVASISLTLSYDPAKIVYLDYSNPHPALASGVFFANSTGSDIKIAWFSLNAANIETGTLVTLRFKHIQGHGSLHWDTSPGACQYGNVAGNTLPSAFTDGYLSAPGAVVQSPLNDTITTNDTAVFNVTTIGTTLTYRWQENSGSGWVDVFNGFFYSGASTATLKVLKPALSFDGNQYRCRTTGTCPSPGNVDFSLPATLTVIPPCQNAVAYAGNDTIICTGDTLNLHGSASNFQQISWSGGDGIFSSPNSLITSYVPGANDLLSGAVTINLHGIAFAPCQNATSQIFISIQSCVVNQAPVFLLNNLPIDTLSQPALFASDTNICLTLFDPDNDSVYLASILQYPAHGLITGFFSGDLCFTYSPAPLYLGQDQMIITGCDTFGACDTLLIIFSVVLPPYNLPPLALQSGIITDTIRKLLPVNLGGALCVTAYDPEGYPSDLTSIIALPQHGIISGLGTGDTCVFYTPDFLYLGPDTFTLALCDSLGACSPVSFIVSVTDFQIPVPPVALPDSFTLFESTSLWCPVLQNDYDLNGNLDTASISLVTLPSNGLAIADTNTGMISYTPNLFYYGPDLFYYRICDDSGACDTARVALKVMPVFDPPQHDTFVGFEDHTIVCTVLDNDQYPFQVIDTTSLSIFQQPLHGAAVVDINAGVILYTPLLDFFGLDSFKYRICDTLNMCGTASVYLSILPVNDPPRLLAVNGIPAIPGNAIILQACENDSVSVCLRLMDPENDIPFIDAIWSASPNAGISITGTGDTCFTYYPALGYSGMDTVYCVLSDELDQDTVRLFIHVNPSPFVYAGADTAICSGAVFYVLNAHATGTSAVVWKTLGSGVFLDSTTLLATYIPSLLDLNSGSVRLVLTAYGNPICGQMKDTIFISFRPLPEVWLGADTTLCENNTLVLDGGAGQYTWLWSTGHTSRYLSVDTFLIGMGPTVIGITVTDAYGCANEDQIRITYIYCPGMSEQMQGVGITVYPNPSQGEFYIEIHSANESKPMIKISDLQGRIISANINWISGNHCVIQTGAYSPGIYLLTLYGERWITVKKIVLN